MKLEVTPTDFLTLPIRRDEMMTQRSPRDRWL